MAPELLEMPGRRHDRGILALLLAVIAALLLGGVISTSGRSVASAAALPDAAAAAAAGPGTQGAGTREIVVSETSDLPATGAKITVSGKGFDPKLDLYVAVCAADIAPGDALTYCVDGAIPDGNTGKAWALITKSPDGNNKNSLAWKADGSFSAPLTIDAATGSSVDCVNKGCVVIARTAGAKDNRPPDITVPLAFAKPPPTTPSTESLPNAPSTVGPDAVALPSAVQGDQQTVVFAGFTPAEAVDVKVFSDPINIPNISASEAGIVTISFRVPADLLPGQHTVQAIGAQSRTVGIANFAVVAAPVTTSAVSSSSEATTSSASQTTSSAAVITTSASSSTTASPTSAAAPVNGNDSSGPSVWWLWVILGLVLIIGAVIGIIALSRRRAALLEQDRQDQENELAAAAAASAQVRPARQPWQPGHDRLQDPDQAGGLLSGRNPDDGPALYSGQGGFQGQGPGAGPPPSEAPTQWIPTPPTPQEPPSDPDPGPGTAQWSPFSDDDTDDDPDNPGTGPDHDDPDLGDHGRR